MKIDALYKIHEESFIKKYGTCAYGKLLNLWDRFNSRDGQVVKLYLFDITGKFAVRDKDGYPICYTTLEENLELYEPLKEKLDIILK